MGKQTLLRWIEEAEASQVRAAAMQRRCGLAAGGATFRSAAAPARPSGWTSFTTTIGRWWSARPKERRAAC